ncbi:type II secretion system protein [Collimonas sp.]|jgi:type II secretory pathway pseudopilin PulG|uniref:type II secretion system protein n=1 Tax=Collimonas sp. TaxID=1963772 RepID=UPI002B67CA06|nr:type II secretion system protein [Collimonas sp.]HWX01187.1 type II secretion system protein [Collimonas sp.]
MMASRSVSYSVMRKIQRTIPAPHGLMSPLRQQGFALLALLIFLAMVALLTSAVATSSALVARRTAEERLLDVGRQYRTAIQLYVESTPPGQKRFPPTLDALLKDPRYPDTRRYLRSAYPDPVGKADWVLISAPDGGIMGLHSASTDRPIRRSGYVAPFEQFNQLERYADWLFYYYPSN